MVETACYHHHPENASHYREIVAAVQVADVLVRYANIGFSGNRSEVLPEAWMETSGWSLLFPHQSDSELSIAKASLKRSLERLPTILEGLV